MTIDVLNVFANDFLKMNDAQFECVNRAIDLHNDEYMYNDRFKFTNNEIDDDREKYFDYEFIKYVYNVLCKFDKYTRDNFDDLIDVYDYIVQSEYETYFVNMNLTFYIQHMNSQIEYVYNYNYSNDRIAHMTLREYYNN